MKVRAIPALIATTALFALATPPSPAEAVPPKWKNCTVVNKRYPHGVGKEGAHDRTSGTPVTNFRRSNKLYAEAMNANKGLDRDKDKIACEKQ